MDKSEIALQLTLKALDNKNIVMKGSNDGKVEASNEFNSKQIANFFNSVYASISTDEEFAVQT